MIPRTLTTLALGAALLAAPPHAAHAQNRVAVTATASVDNPEPAPGEAVIYTIRVRIQGAQMSLGAISAPKVPAGLAAAPLEPVGKSESFEIINGAVSQSTDYRFVFTASKEGEYEIPAQELLFQNERIPVNAVKVRVARTAAPANLPAELKDLVAAPSAPGNPELAKNLNGSLFILPMISSRKVFEGQQVVLSYHLVWDPAIFQRVGLRTDTLLVEGVEMPKFAQFLKEVTHPLPRSLADVRQDRIFGSRTYTVATLLEVVLTPTRTGTLEIEPARIGMQIPLQRRGAATPLDPFANDPFFADDPIFGSLSARMGAGQRVRLIANSPTLSIEVVPVPAEGRPADWNGAVGSFEIAAAIDRSTATAHQDIVRLDVTVEGLGDAASLSPPQLNLPDGLRLLEEPKSTTRSRRVNDQPLQSKTFTYLLRPERPGTLPIPPVAMSIFDPESAAYERIESEPLSVDILPGAAPATAVTIARTPSQPSLPGQNAAENPGAPAAPQALDLRFLPAHPPRLAQSIPGTGAVVLIVVCPPLLTGALVLMVRRSEARARAFLHSQQQDWNALLASGLQAARQPWPENVHALARIIRSDLARYLQVPAEAPTINDLVDALEARLPADSPDTGKRTAALRAILATSDSLKFAPPSAQPPPDDFEQLATTLLSPPDSKDQAHA